MTNMEISDLLASRGMEPWAMTGCGARSRRPPGSLLVLSGTPPRAAWWRPRAEPSTVLARRQHFGGGGGPVAHPWQNCASKPPSDRSSAWSRGRARGIAGLRTAEGQADKASHMGKCCRPRSTGPDAECTNLHTRPQGAAGRMKMFESPRDASRGRATRDVNNAPAKPRTAPPRHARPAKAPRDPGTPATSPLEATRSPATARGPARRLKPHCPTSG